MIYRARGGDKSASSLPSRILAFQILGPQNRRFRIGGIAKLVKIEQISPEVLHFRKWSFLERLNKTTFSTNITTSTGTSTTTNTNMNTNANINPPAPSGPSGC